MRSSLDSRTRSSRILADAYEALAGAVYLDGGYDAAEQCFADHLAEAIAQTTQVLDFKTRLQETCHRLGLPHPRYDVVSIEGPDHARVFTCQVVIGDRVFGPGAGSSKKVAEQCCAQLAAQDLGLEPL